MCFGVLIQFLTISLLVSGVSIKGCLRIVQDESDESSTNDIIAGKMFSSSLALVIIFLELIYVVHAGGFKRTLDHHFVMDNEGRRKPNWLIIILSLFKVSIIVFCATLSQWSSEPDVITGAGCAAVFALSVTRVLDKHYIIYEEEEEENASDVRAIDLVVTESLSRDDEHVSPYPIMQFQEPTMDKTANEE